MDNQTDIVFVRRMGESTTALTITTTTAQNPVVLGCDKLEAMRPIEDVAL